MFKAPTDQIKAKLSLAKVLCEVHIKNGTHDDYLEHCVHFINLFNRNKTDFYNIPAKYYDVVSSVVKRNSSIFKVLIPANKYELLRDELTAILNTQAKHL